MIRKLAAAVLLASAVPAYATKPVVVELFTSQGCSSCPDADALLSSWGAQGFREGSILPLSFNVDYWNYFGWKDLFSAPEWSVRQARYASAIGDRTYTPQMVVAGRVSFVGSDARRAQAAVASLGDEPQRARLGLVSTPSPQVKLDLSVAPVSESANGLHLVLVLFESGLLTDVSAGENAGRRLRNDFVVRRLVDLGPLDSRRTFRRRWAGPWDPTWKKERAGAAIFLQDPRTLAIFDARAVYPLASRSQE